MSKDLIYRILISLFLAPFVLLLIFLGNYYFKILVFLIFIISLYEIKKLNKNILKFTIFLLLVVFVYACLNLHDQENGKVYVYFVLILTWLSDIGGYAIGKIIGGTKINFISKNKTYSGFIGSICFSQFSLIFLSYFEITFFYNLLFDMIIISVFSIIVIIGDLFFSYIKRINNLKDYSNLLSSHGGLLDRIDGLVFVTIFFYLFIRIL